MTPEQLGHRAAAQGDGRETCPFLTPGPERTLWEIAWDHAEAQRAAGRDPTGHPPIPPHVCTKNAMKVCNCCTTCTRGCKDEMATGKVPVAIRLAPSIGAVAAFVLKTAMQFGAAVERTRTAATPVPMILHCPACRLQHVDKDEWATKLHRTHLCAGCGNKWRPAAIATVGVAELAR